MEACQHHQTKKCKASIKYPKGIYCGLFALKPGLKGMSALVKDIKVCPDSENVFNGRGKKKRGNRK